MDAFVAANLFAAIVAVVALALVPSRIARPMAILLAAGAVGLFLWAESFSQSCASDGCIGVIVPGLLCAACVVALAIGLLARRVVGAIRGRTGQGHD